MYPSPLLPIYNVIPFNPVQTGVGAFEARANFEDV